MVHKHQQNMGMPVLQWINLHHNACMHESRNNKDEEEERLEEPKCWGVCYETVSPRNSYTNGTRTAILMYMFTRNAGNFHEVPSLYKELQQLMTFGTRTVS